MLFLPSRKFLFIKTNKTASTSIELALSRLFFSEPDLFFTPLDFHDECLRLQYFNSTYNFNRLPSISLFNHKKLPLSLRLLKFQLSMLLKKSFIPDNNLSCLARAHQIYCKKHYFITGYHPHISYTGALLLNSDFYNYHSISFTRHPFKRFYSFLLYRAKKYLHINVTKNWSNSDWVDFANSIFPDFAKRSISSYVYDLRSSSCVSTVYAFENMKESLFDLSLKFGFQPNKIFDLLPISKSSSGFSSVNQVPINNIFTSEIKAKILKCEEWSFECFDYKESVDDFGTSRIFWQSAHD